MAPSSLPSYEDGLELAQYQDQSNKYDNKNGGVDDYGGMSVNTYQGMAFNEYPGGAASPGATINFSDNQSEKLPFHSKVFEEDLRSRLHRGLKTRHISMVALGGALGTGLLINTGSSLAQSGPVSMLIGYALVGVISYTVLAGLGEMAAWLPIASGFTGFAQRFVDPALGFALGWNYWFYNIVTTPKNLIASTLVIKFWFDKAGYDGPGANPAIYVTVILISIILINYFGVGFFGEFEFWLGSAKVLIMFGLIFFTLVLASRKTDGHAAAGFQYWSNPGAFAPYIATGSLGRFLGFWNVLSSALFSYLGAELVGVTVGEAQNPRKAVPRAVRNTFIRIIFFYIILIFLLGLTVPYNSPLLISANNQIGKTVSANSSPFVVAAILAGANTIPDVINACLLIFTFSAANSDLYIATRSIYSLAVERNAPRIFAYTNDRGVPIYALALSGGLCLTAYMSVDVGTFATFEYFVSLVTIFGGLSWVSILISHIYFIRARRAQNIPDTALAYVSPFGETGSLVALISTSIIIFFNGFADFIPNPVTGQSFRWQQFIVDYIGIIIFGFMALGYKIYMKTEIHSPLNADLRTGKAKIDEDEAEFLACKVEREKYLHPNRKKLLMFWRRTLGIFF